MITPVEVITKTRDQVPLSEEEIRFFIKGIAEEKVELHQAAAWLMAVRLQGLGQQETVWLTQAMIDSGEVVDLSSIEGRRVGAAAGCASFPESGETMVNETRLVIFRPSGAR